VLVSIIIWFQTRGTRKFDKSSGGTSGLERLRTTVLVRVKRKLRPWMYLSLFMWIVSCTCLNLCICVEVKENV